MFWQKKKSAEKILRCIGMNQHTLYRKLSSGGDTFSVGEIWKIVKALSLTNEETINIFLINSRIIATE